MKAVRVLLLIAALGVVAVSAHADGFTDPQIKLGPSGKSTHTMDGSTAADPIFVADGTQTDWFLDNPQIAANGLLFIEVVPQQGQSLSSFLNEGFTCVPVQPVATGCSFLAGLQGLSSNAVAQGFGYLLNCTSFDATGEQVSVGCPAVEVVFSGPFTVGEDVSITVPEPGVLLLVLAGLAFAFFFRPRRSAVAAAF